MCRKYGWLVAVIAALLFAACPIEGDVSFGDEEEFTITYSANGGTGSVPAPQTAEAGAHIVLPNADGLSRTGYVFGGWCANAAGTGTKFAAGSAYTMPDSNSTLYAFWNNNTQTHTVTFNVNGGSGSAPASQTAQAGSSITLPGVGGMSRSGFTFGGWNTNAGGTGSSYNAGDSYPVNANVTLYVKWNPAAANPPPGGGIRDNGTSLAAQFEWLQTNAVSGGDYTIEISANETISSSCYFIYNGKSNITIHLKGVGAGRIIGAAPSIRNMFTIDQGVTLILDNITLQGNSGMSSHICWVSRNASLIMNAGSKLTGCGVEAVEVYGFFIMNGGEISGNAGSGVRNDGNFTMKGGTISNNVSSAWGGGVYNSGTFNMEGGTISGNTAVNDGYTGGGISIHSGTFNKTGGTIYGYTNGDSKSNVGNVVGHAIYVSALTNGNYQNVTKWKDTTSGPGDNLYFNTSNGSFSGAWDY